MWLGFPKKIVFLPATLLISWKKEHNLSFGNNKIYYFWSIPLLMVSNDHLKKYGIYLTESKIIKYEC